MPGRSDEALLRDLHRRRARERHGLFLAEGVRVVEELLDSGIDPHVAVVSPSLEDTPRGRELARRLSAEVRTERVAEHVLDGLAATDSPQGVVVAARIPEPEAPRVGEDQRFTVLVLDAVQDPGNFGTLVRSADAFGAGAVVALPGTVDPWNPKSVRAAAGSSFRVPILQWSADRCREWLVSRGFVVLGADVSGEPVERISTPPRSALVVGNEGAGLGEHLAPMIDRWVSIPLRGPAESLNVAVAAGILLYFLTRDPQ